jgi:hypothetical protein
MRKRDFYWGRIPRGFPNASHFPATSLLLLKWRVLYTISIKNIRRERMMEGACRPKDFGFPTWIKSTWDSIEYSSFNHLKKFKYSNQ